MRGLSCGLYNEAYIALAKAVERHDPERFQNGLTAYAIHWIKGSLQRFVTKKRTLVPGRRNERGKYRPLNDSVFRQCGDWGGHG
jgi:DNA-directed RNA polymerase specialized sigma subunit